MNPRSDTLSLGDVITDAAGFLAALGAGTMILFPFRSLPCPDRRAADAAGRRRRAAGRRSSRACLTLVALRRVARPSTTDHKARA